MTPEQEARLNEVYAFMQDMRVGARVPISVQKALETRFKGLFGQSTGSFTTNSIRRTITLTGNAEDISVLEDPAGYISTVFNGTTYKIPYWVE